MGNYFGIRFLCDNASLPNTLVGWYPHHLYEMRIFSAFLKMRGSPRLLSLVHVFWASFTRGKVQTFDCTLQRS